jgi:hypothetical protein
VPRKFLAGGSAWGAAAGDFNEDGFPDLAFTHRWQDRFLVQFGDGFGGLLGHTLQHTGREPTAIGTGDFDEDGHEDLVVACTSGAAVAIHRGDGQRGFTLPWLRELGDSPVDVCAADLSEDGHLDLVLVMKESENVRVLYGDGTGQFPGELGLITDAVATNAVAADLDEDDHLDIAVSNADWSGDFVSVFLGDGTGGFGFLTNVLVRKSRALAVADLDGDGHVDLASAGEYHNAVYTVYGDGTGAFGGLQIFQVGDSPSTLVAEDLNGDGWPDLVCANRDSDTASVLVNLGPPAPDRWTMRGRAVRQGR